MNRSRSLRANTTNGAIRVSRSTTSTCCPDSPYGQDRSTSLSGDVHHHRSVGQPEVQHTSSLAKSGGEAARHARPIRTRSCLHTNMGSGPRGRSGRFRRYRERPPWSMRSRSDSSNSTGEAGGGGGGGATDYAVAVPPPGIVLGWSCTPANRCATVLKECNRHTRSGACPHGPSRRDFCKAVVVGAAGAAVAALAPQTLPGAETAMLKRKIPRPVRNCR